MLMDVLAERKVGVFGVGKIHDIYNGRGVQEYVTTKGNADGMEKLTAAASERKSGLIFCNLVDFDMLYAIEKTSRICKIAGRIRPHACGFFAAAESLRHVDDHRGSRCDPDPRWPTTDHSREYVPILAYSPRGGAV